MTIQWYDARNGSAPVVSIAEYGITFFNGTLTIMKNPDFIKLGFDKDKSSIVAAPCNEDDDNAIEFISRKRNGYVRIGNKDFIRFIKSMMNDEMIITKNATKYLAKWNDDENLLEISLNNPLDKENIDR